MVWVLVLFGAALLSVAYAARTAEAEPVGCIKPPKGLGMTCGTGEQSEWKAYIFFVSNCTKIWAGFRKSGLPPNIVAEEMMKARKDWELAAALYRVNRRREILGEIFDREFRQN